MSDPRLTRTVITRDDMAVIFERIAASDRVAVIAREIGYDVETVRRGVVLAKLLGFEGCGQ